MKRKLLGITLAVILGSVINNAEMLWAEGTQADPAQAENAAAPKPAETAPATPEPTWPPGVFMDLLKPTAAGKGLDGIGLRIYGYGEGGFTGRLSGGQDPLPGRTYDARRPNELRLNQFDLTVDRPYDSNKTADFGMRVDNIFGGDAKLTHSRGFFENAGVGRSDVWYDMLQAYTQGWFKTGAESGLEITAGKFLELAGSEVALATSNALYSHSFIYTFAEPTTHTGGMVKYVVNSQYFVYAGGVEGWDVTRDNNGSATLIAGGGWGSKAQVDGHARTQVLLNLIAGPEQYHNNSDNRVLTDVVINHFWTANLSQSLNFDWVTEYQPDIGGREHAYGIAHYLTYVFNDYLSGTWRTEWFRDEKGTRIGTAGSFFENTWGVTIKPFASHGVLKNFMVRPELRWDASTEPAFGGDRHDQLTLAADAIFRF